jgi:Cu-processing system ATP-binding protein
MIHVEGLSKNFGKLKALDDVSLQCNTGECISLIGPNGSGKTTLIKSILGMVIPTRGSITVNGVNTHNNYKYRSAIGYMPQIGHYPDNMTIGQVFATLKDVRRSTKSFDEELLMEFGLDKLMNKSMRALSGGTRQKVSAALAFLFDPEILILDEPTSGLDPLSNEILKAKIKREHAQGKLILITSHILSDLDELVTEVIYMQDGKPLFHQPFEDLQRETGEQKLSKAIAEVMKRQTNRVKV